MLDLRLRRKSHEFQARLARRGVGSETVSKLAEFGASRRALIQETEKEG